MPATLLEFSHVNDAAGATTKKLAKQATLAEYFRRLEDDDLRRAVRYCAGRVFPVTQDRAINVGGALVSDVVLDILRVDPRVYSEAIIQSGEIGEALGKLWPAPTDNGKPLKLEDLSDAFEDVSRTGQFENKRRILRELFSRCAHPREATYLAKIIFGDLRTGVQEGVLQAAVAQAFGNTLSEIHRAQLLVGDLDEVAVLARHDALATARFRLFHPIQFMLATSMETAADAAEKIGARGPYYI
jgi:DNA ligase-1